MSSTGGVVNPDKVACIYADNPALFEEDFAKIPELASMTYLCCTSSALRIRVCYGTL